MKIIFLSLLTVILILFSVWNTAAQIFDNPYSRPDWVQYNEGLKKVWINPSFQFNRYLKKYGFVDSKGKLAVSYRFDDAEYFSDGLAPACINRFWGFINKSGEPVIPMKYDAAGVFSEGLAPVKTNNLIGFINSAGTWVIPPKYPSYGTADYAITETGFSQGMCPVYNGKYYYYIDKAEKIILPGPYRYASRFRNGLAIASVDSLAEVSPRYKYDENYNIITNETGEKLIERFDTIWTDKYVLINTKGTIEENDFIPVDTLPFNLLLIQHDSAYSIYCQGVKIPVRSLFKICISDKYIVTDITNVFDHQGKPVSKPKFSGRTGFIYFMEDQPAVTFDEFCITTERYGNLPGGAWYLCDLEYGFAVNVNPFASVENLCPGIWKVSDENGNSGLMDDLGKVILPVEYSEITKASDEYLIIRKNGLAGLASSLGRILIEPEYTDFNFLTEDYFSFSVEPTTSFDEAGVQQWHSGVINSQKKIIFQPEYERIFLISYNLLVLSKGKQQGVAGLDGNFIIPLKENCSYKLLMGVIRCEKDSVLSWYDDKGKILTNGMSYNWAVFPGVLLKRNDIRLHPMNGVTSGKWTILSNTGKNLLDEACDSIFGFSNCFIAYNGRANYLISTSGKIAGPYDNIIQPSAAWGDNIFEVNTGGKLLTIVTPGDTMYIENPETGELMYLTEKNGWSYFSGGRCGLISSDAQVLVEPLYSKLKVTVITQREMPGEPGIYSERMYRMVDLSSADFPSGTRNGSITMDYPVQVIKGDSAGIIDIRTKTRMMVSGDSIDYLDPLYVVINTKKKCRQVISVTDGISPVFSQMMSIAGEEEIVDYVVNTGGRCDTTYVERRDTVVVENPETLEMVPYIVVSTDIYPWFTGGKFQLLANTGAILTRTLYDGMKLPCFIFSYNSEEGTTIYLDISDKNSGLKTNPHVDLKFPIMVRCEKKWGLINRAGAEILPVLYDSIRWENGTYYVFGQKKVYRLDSLWKPVSISDLAPLPEKRIMIQGENNENFSIFPLYLFSQKGVIDSIQKDFKVMTIDIYGNDYEAVIPFKKMYFSSGKTGLTDRYGMIILPPEYDSISILQSNGSNCIEYTSSDTLGVDISSYANTSTCFKVCKNGLWGVTDIRGNWIIKPEYKSIIYVIADTDSHFECTRPDNSVDEVFHRLFF